MIQKTCELCKGLFNYEPPKDFPDRRKYCDPCSAKRKAEWEAKQATPVQETTGNTGIGTDVAPKKQFEAHLSIEQIRTNAVEFAFKMCKDKDNIDFKQVIQKFENYLLTGIY